MNNLKLPLLLAICLTLFGCSSSKFSSVTQFTSYDDFQPGPEDGVELVWATEALRDPASLQEKIASYDSVMIQNVHVVVVEDELSEEQTLELSHYFIGKLKETVSPYKQVVETVGEETLVLDIALSNIETPNPILTKTSSILPFGIAISMISKVTTGEHTNVGKVSIEVVVRDGKSNKALFAAIDRRTGNKDLGTMLYALDDPKDAIDWWMNRLSVTLSINEKLQNTDM